jgi:MFS family permease
MSWRRLVAIFSVTALVESLGVAQVFALLPAQLEQMGVTGNDRLTFVGLFTSLLFVLGMPLVPLWGVWADRYSRKAVIARSAFIEVLVFGGLAVASQPWQVAAALLGAGLQLGNTGVMLAGMRDVVPARRLGTIISVFGAASAVGWAVGPLLAGVLIDGLGWSIGGVFGLSAGLSLGTGLLVIFGTTEVRPPTAGSGSVVRLAFGAIRGLLADASVRRIFLIFGIALLANQMSRPYIPVLVESVVGSGPGLASAIGLVAGTAALAGALMSPGTGWLGDRIGFRPVLLVALVAGGLALGAMPLVAPAGGVAALALLAVVLSAAAATVSAMVFGLVAIEVPEERRATTLNLVYLPLYLAGIVGPAIGAGVSSSIGLGAPFGVGALAFVSGAIVVALRRADRAPGARRTGHPAG